MTREELARRLFEAYVVAACGVSPGTAREDWEHIARSYHETRGWLAVADLVMERERTVDQRYTTAMQESADELGQVSRQRDALQRRLDEAVAMYGLFTPTGADVVDTSWQAVPGYEPVLIVRGRR